MQMGMKRFTRLTNGFCKKVENHARAIALHFMHYNFCRVHQTLRVTPAMEAGIGDHVWSSDEIVSGQEFLDKWRAGDFKDMDSSDCPGVIGVALLAPSELSPGRKHKKRSTR